MSDKKLGFGMMRLPRTDPNDDGSVDFELTKQMVDLFLERGFTYFDTAWMYCDHRSEEAVKICLTDRHPREKYTITTKLPAYMLKSEADRDWLFNEQLRKTGAGYFDYYLLHDVNSNTLPGFEKYDCFRWIKEKKASGAVKKIGFSYHDGPELLDELLTKHPEFDVVQLQINYLDWESAAIQSRACYEVAEKHGKPVIVMEPVKGGTLANVPEEAAALFRAHQPERSMPSWAIRFAASQKNVMMVLSGMSNLAQLEDNTDYMQHFQPLTGEETALCLKAAEIINADITIPCTGCSYCTVKCPKNIAIPQYFSLYNADYKINQDRVWNSHCGYYEHVSSRFGKAEDCIRCGQCEAMCPQHLHIRDLLKTVDDYFKQIN